MNVENDNTNMRIIIVAERDFECGLLGLVNYLRKEPGGEMIRSVFIQDGDAPAFLLQESLYMRQLQLDLPINVIRSGIWGSYRHFPLSLLEPKLVQSAYVSQMVRFQEDSVFRKIEIMIICDTFFHKLSNNFSYCNFKRLKMTCYIYLFRCEVI